MDKLNLSKRWTPDQMEKAYQIVNDIAEGIDNKDTYEELRTSLAIYADLLFDEREQRHDEKLDQLIKLTEILNVPRI